MTVVHEVIDQSLHIDQKITAFLALSCSRNPLLFIALLAYHCLSTKVNEKHIKSRQCIQSIDLPGEYITNYIQQPDSL